MYVVAFGLAILAALCFFFEWITPPEKKVNTVLGLFFTALSLAALIWWMSDGLHHILSGG